jgi:uncharacterized protein
MNSMNKRVLIIHGWDGFPDEGWFPWLKKELESKGFTVTVPAMPKPEVPEISSWVNTLNEIVGEIDEQTFLVGHSIGCQTILRYLERLEKNKKVGGVVFVAGWTHLTPEVTPDEASIKVAKPWLETPLNWGKIKSHTNNVVAIFSDNDPMVSLSEKDVFKDKLRANIIIENNKKHFSGDDGIHKLSVVLDVLNEMVKS